MTRDPEPIQKLLNQPPPDVTTPAYQRLAIALARIGKEHPYVGTTDVDEALNSLIRPSVLAFPLLKFGRAVLDAGTGIGIPGLPLVLLEPARPMHLVEPRQGCIGLINWITSKLPPLNLNIHPQQLESLRSERLPPTQVVTRSALDWSSLRQFVPTNEGPIIRWSGPSVAHPPNRPAWTSTRLRVHHDRFDQEFIWWGPTELFHVKQTHWNILEQFSVQRLN
jgi:hypothetical protein